MPAARLLAAVAALAVAVPAGAQQFSDSYKFLQAVRDAKGDVVVKMVSEPGSTIVNTRDKTTGESALHILVKTDNARFMEYLLQQKADPNLRDQAGNTPLILAMTLGKTDLVPLLIRYRANLNLGNSIGETPLILAVQRRDLAMARLMIEQGANPDKTDNVGMSARDYAARDGRSPDIVKLLATVPKQTTKPVAGPKL